MPISGDDGFGFPGDGRFEHAVVWRVCLDLVDGFGWLDDARDPRHLTDRFFRRVAVPSELCRQDPCELGEKGRGRDQFDALLEDQAINELRGAAREYKCRDEDVR